MTNNSCKCAALQQALMENLSNKESWPTPTTTTSRSNLFSPPRSSKRVGQDHQTTKLHTGPGQIRHRLQCPQRPPSSTTSETIIIHQGPKILSQIEIPHLSRSPKFLLPDPHCKERLVLDGCHDTIQRCPHHNPSRPRPPKLRSRAWRASRVHPQKPHHLRPLRDHQRRHPDWRGHH